MSNAQTRQSGHQTQQYGRWVWRISLTLCLVAYIVLLALHPDADKVSKFPEPVNHFLYEANFPGHRGAEPFTKLIHRSRPSAKCAEISSSHFRNVSIERCRNLLINLGLGEKIPETGNDKCSYYYSSVRAAEIGVDVSFVVLDAKCISPNGQISTFVR